MELLHNIELSTKTTFRVGGIAQDYYIPESVEELLAVISSLDKQPYQIISGGSNLLINDERVFSHVISMEKVDRSIENKKNGLFYVGASNRIQKVILFVNECGYGGFEELIGLPALFGGVVCMNAGIGGRDRVKFSISDFVVRVKCIDRESLKIEWIDRANCDFSYRHSVFLEDRYIIIGAEINCTAQSLKQSKERIKARTEYCKKNQDWGNGCFGSCFSICDKRLLRIAHVVFRKRLIGIRVSEKNSNWIMNNGNASYRETIQYIRACEFVHRLFFKRIQREIRVWE